MFKDTIEGATNYCTHKTGNPSGICDKCFGKEPKELGKEGKVEKKDGCSKCWNYMGVKDSCPCDCHKPNEFNKVKPEGVGERPMQNWEKEFDNKFDSADTGICSTQIISKNPNIRPDIKSFIRQLLLSKSEEIEKMKKQVPLGLNPEEWEEVKSYNDVFNAGIQCAIDILSK